MAYTVSVCVCARQRLSALPGKPTQLTVDTDIALGGWSDGRAVGRTVGRCRLSAHMAPCLCVLLSLYAASSAPPTRAFVCNIYCMCLAMKAGTSIHCQRCQRPVARRQALQCLFICVYSTLNCAIKARLLLFQLCESHWIHSALGTRLRTQVSGLRTQDSGLGAMCVRAELCCVLCAVLVSKITI